MKDSFFFFVADIYKKLSVVCSIEKRKTDLHEDDDGAVLDFSYDCAVRCLFMYNNMFGMFPRECVSECVS